MQPIKRMILSVLAFAVVFSGTSAQAQAAATDLPVGVLIGSQDGLRVPVTGEFFINAEDLEAGDVITKKLTISNTEPYAYKISMRAEPREESGPLRLLDETRCTLTLDGKVLYDGRVRGDEGINMIVNALDLGTFQSGQQRTLDIRLTVSPEMKKYYYTASEAIFRWYFYAARDERQEGPKTGEMVKNSMYIVFPALTLAMGVLLLAKRRKQAIAE